MEVTMVRRHDDGSLEDEELVREGGVFVSRDGGHEVGCEDGTCASDEWVEDPGTGDGVPGTADDLPYDYGVETARPTDQLITSPDHRGPGISGLGGVGETGADEDAEEPPLGRPEERELWRQQRALIQESGDEAARYRGLRDDEVARVEDAVGEDAGEVLPDAPEGESATGAS
jgi:hypothetical protein